MNYQAETRRRIIARIDWKTCPFTRDNLPEGRWGTNSRGNDYVACPDGSFYYFNRDSGFYYSDGGPGIPGAPGCSVYRAPNKETYYTPTKEEAKTGSYFTGIHWQTGREKVYWEADDGSIYLTPRSNIAEMDAKDLETGNVACYDNEKGVQRVVEVDSDGVYHGDDEVLKEEIRKFRHQSDPPVKLPAKAPKARWSPQPTPTEVYVKPEPMEDNRVAPSIQRELFSAQAHMNQVYFPPEPVHNAPALPPQQPPQVYHDPGPVTPLYGAPPSQVYNDPGPIQQTPIVVTPQPGRAEVHVKVEPVREIQVTPNMRGVPFSPEAHINQVYFNPGPTKNIPRPVTPQTVPAEVYVKVEPVQDIQVAPNMQGVPFSAEAYLNQVYFSPGPAHNIPGSIAPQPRPAGVSVAERVLPAIVSETQEPYSQSRFDETVAEAKRLIASLRADLQVNAQELPVNSESVVESTGARTTVLSEPASPVEVANGDIQSNVEADVVNVKVEEVPFEDLHVKVEPVEAVDGVASAEFDEAPLQSKIIQEDTEPETEPVEVVLENISAELKTASPQSELIQEHVDQEPGPEEVVRGVIRADVNGASPQHQVIQDFQPKIKPTEEADGIISAEATEPSPHFEVVQKDAERKIESVDVCQVMERGFDERNELKTNARNEFSETGKEIGETSVMEGKDVAPQAEAKHGTTRQNISLQGEVALPKVKSRKSHNMQETAQVVVHEVFAEESILNTGPSNEPTELGKEKVVKHTSIWRGCFASIIPIFHRKSKSSKARSRQ